MGETVEDQPVGDVAPAERPSLERAQSEAPLSSSSPSGADGAGERFQPESQPERRAGSMALSSELDPDALLPLFPPLAPLPAPTRADAASGAPALPGSGGLLPDAPDAPAGLDAAAPLDGDTAPMQTLRERLSPRSPASGDAATQRLNRPRPVVGGGIQPPIRPRPAVDGETQRLAPKGEITEQETLRLSQKQLAEIVETERLARGDAGSSPDYTLPIRATPVNGAGAPPPGWREEVEKALQEEARMALSMFSAPSSPSTPSTPSTPSFPSTPSMPPASTDDEMGDETLMVVRALRLEMNTRVTLRRRALALLTQPAVLVMAVAAVAQMVALPLWRARGLPDEIAAFQAGQRLLAGRIQFGSPQALANLVGTLFWSVVASAGYLTGGLAGARLIAIVCTAAAGLATASAAKNLFGQVAGLFTAITFAFMGLVMYFAHLAVPDQLALVGIAVSFWAITQASVTRRRTWLIVAVCACVLGVIAQYTAILCLIPLIAVALALRGRPAFTGLYISGLIVVMIVVSRVFPAHESVFAILPQRSRAGLSLSLSVSAAGLQLLYDGVVLWGLVIAGWIAGREKGRLGVSLVAGMLVWPVYLALAGGAMDAERRLVFGCVFGLPLAGAAIAAVWSAGPGHSMPRRALVIVLLLAVGMVGIIQARALDNGNGAITPHAVHATLGKADVGAPTSPLAGHAALDAARVVGPNSR